jgi:hypothetical protein
MFTECPTAQVKIERYMFKRPEAVLYHHDMTNFTFKPTPPIIHRSAHAAGECRNR